MPLLPHNLSHVQVTMGGAVTLQPITANLLWRFDTSALTVVPNDTAIALWPDTSGNGRDLTYPGRGFVFIPPFPHYWAGVFGSQAAARMNENQPANNEADIGSQAIFGVPVSGVSSTHYFIANIGDASLWTFNGGDGILLDYPDGLGVLGNTTLIPYYGGTNLGGTGLTMGFGYEVNGGGISLVNIADRVAGSSVLVWVFDKATGKASAYQNTTLLGQTAVIPDLLGGFQFGFYQSTVFSDFAGNSGPQGDVAGYYAYSVAHTAAQIAQNVAALKQRYSLP